jgi:type I restriction enzyme M protein
MVTKTKKAKKPTAPSNRSKPLLALKTTTPTLHAELQINARGEIWCALAKEGLGEWRRPTPEERVRQQFVAVLQAHYGYVLDQMRQERKTQAGKRSPRVDIALWESAAARVSTPSQSPKIVVECKAENIAIHRLDYYQGESYARAVGAEILVMHNERQTAIFRVIPGLPGELVQINELPKASDWGDAKRIEAIKNATRAFSRDEFRDLLFRCHSILRDVHKMDPGRAFDTMSKILFIKMYIERTGTWGTFTTAFLRAREKTRLPTDDPVHVQLFEQTKRFYRDDELFGKDDRLDEISDETFARVVKELERFNLSATGDDVKGIAFEKFLGDTFRGDLGQFFTPRTVVDFMIQVLDPREGQLICDPCSGSGGFLIRAFEHVRTQIEVDVQKQKDAARAKIEAEGLSEEKELAKVNQAFARLNLELESDNKAPPSRIYRLAHDYIFGTDAEGRAARTSKMNMIMHGDGHGGIHYHDGLLDINGIFPGRFDIVLTNPPFGSNVGSDQQVGATDQTRVPHSTEYLRQCEERYRAPWKVAHDRLVQAARSKTPILELFELGKEKPNRPTEVLFVERCLQLLKPGGRLGIVLPDGNLNNPSLSWLRRWAEGKARLLAVVSLPEDTFKSADATVKASIVFLRKFTATDEKRWDDAWKTAHAQHDIDFASRRDGLWIKYDSRISSAEDPILTQLLSDLQGLGVRRALPQWRLKPPPAYPRGVIQTELGKPRWDGKPKSDDKKKATKLRAAFEKSWTPKHEFRSEDLRRELRAALRRLDRDHSRALWATVRERFDYPVFTAAPKSVGITGTGAEGPSEFPRVLSAWRAFETWVRAGADPQKMPQVESE